MDGAAATGEADRQRSRIRRIWRAVRRGLSAVSDAIGATVSRAILMVLYFVLFALVGVGVRMLSDPLKLRRPEGEGGFWTERRARADDLDSARRQS